MKVKQLLDLLQKIEDKNVVMMLDCPHCGHSTGVGGITEVVVISAKGKGEKA